MKPQAPRIGVILTLAELYRDKVPGISRDYGLYWRRALEDLLKDTAGLHFPPVAHAASEMASAVASCEQAGCDLLLLLPMAYAASGAARDALAASRIPLLLVSTARDAALPPSIGGEHMRANQAMHGVQDLANVLRRAGRRFSLLAGHFSQARFQEKLRGYLAAAAGARVLRRGRTGRIGEPFPGMLDFSFRPDALHRALGMEIVSVAPSRLRDKALGIEAERLEGFRRWLRESFQVSPELGEHQLDTAARWSMAFEDLVLEHAWDAVAFNFQTLMDMPDATLPFLGVNRLMQAGIGYAGEADVLTAALNAAIQRMGVEASFTEMFCPDYTSGEVILSHMGECNPAMADPQAPILLKSKPFDIGRCVAPVVAVFQFRPGPVTLASLSEAPGGHEDQAHFQLLVCRGEITPSAEHPHLTSPYSRVRFGGELSDFLERFSRCGGTHHLVISHGDQSAPLSALAELCGLDLLEV